MTTPDRPGLRARIGAALETRPVSLAVRIIGSASIVVGFAVALTGDLMWGLWLALVGWLLVRVGRSRRDVGRVHRLLDGLVARDAMEADAASVAPTLSVQTLLVEDGRQQGGSGIYPVRSGGALLGMVDVLDVDRLPPAELAALKVEAIMRPLAEVASVPPDRPLMDVLMQLGRSRREGVAVVDPADPGQLLGIVTRERIHGRMRARSAIVERDGPRIRRRMMGR